MSQLAEYLAKADVFDQLSSKEREDLAQLATRRQVKKSETICHEGDDWSFVLFILNGRLRSVINSPEGRSYTVGTWEKGQGFWAHTLFDQTPMPSTLEAAQTTTYYQWDGETALQFVLRNQNAVRALLRRQTRLIRLRRASIYNLAFNPVVSRLAKLIVDKFTSSEEQTMQRDLTLSEMAEMVATSPEVVCRLLYQFQADGAITISRASITLHDLKTLENLIVHK
jgi:CRP/FNR family transcriptional regulator, cyclic AMP receptor protein